MGAARDRLVVAGAIVLGTLVNAATAALLELRLMDLVFRMSRRPVAEVYLDVLNGSLDELPRSRQGNCRQCGPSTGLGDLAKLPHIE